MTFKLVKGTLFDDKGNAFLPERTFKTADEALAWLLIIGMSGVMVYE